jgi:hypothetical protein
MPKSFKRKFSSTKKRHFNKTRKFKKSSSSSSAGSDSRVVALSFKGSLRSLQPMPDTFKTWVTATNSGYWPTGTGTSTNSFQLAIDAICKPFNNTGGTGKLLPNPLVATASESGSGVKNLLYNTDTNTGIYVNYRVWRVILEVQAVPQTQGDSALFAMAPIVNTASQYTSINGITQGVNSVSKMITAGTSGKGDMIKANWSIPAILGIQDNQYATTSTAQSYGYTGNVFPQIGYNLLDGNTALVNTLPVFVKMNQFVEFFRRADGQLLQI